jgi:endonuclease YncB( thermonuclease family)
MNLAEVLSRCLRLLLPLLLAGSAWAAPPLAGTVTRVVDGDSLWVTPAGAAPLEVRLLGIDAPEGCQAWGAEARAALEALALNRPVTLKIQGRDEYGRTLATVFADEVNINQQLVAEGHAWSARYKWDQGPYVKQERAALALRRGLHGAGGAMLPRDFRRTHGPCRAGELPARAPVAEVAAAPAIPVPALGEAAFRCDGRTHCSQMRSCEEATYFLRHCPNVQMDGDGNGIPCEKQWCGRPARR